MSSHASEEKNLVVFLPAVGGDASFWHPQREALNDAYESLAIDFRGPAEQVSMAGFAEQVAERILASGRPSAHVVGLSMGGVVALELAARRPALVRLLALANTWAFQPEGGARWAWASGELAQKSVAEFSEMSMPGLFAPTTSAEIVRRAVAVESAKDHAFYLACWREMLRADLRPALAGIRVPVLLLGGALDPVTPTVPLLTTIRDAVPGARIVDLAGASHFSNLDQPEAFSQALRAHLDEAERVHAHG